MLDGTVLRMAKTYPAYFGTYCAVSPNCATYLDRVENLFLVGRNGMHKYNNQDHSMLTAMMAVENHRAGRTDKTNHLGSEHGDGVSGDAANHFREGG